MDYKINYAPAETYALIDGNNIERNELARQIILGLIFKNVLRIKTERKRSTPKSSYVEYKYLLRGKEYLNYEALDFEEEFLSLHAERAYKYQIKSYAKSIAQIWSSRESIKSLKRGSISKFINTAWYSFFISAVPLNKTGLLEAERCRKVLNLYDKKLVKTPDNQELLKEIVNNLGANVIHLENFEFEQLKNLKLQYASSGSSHFETDFDLNDDLYFFGMLEVFDSFTDSSDFDLGDTNFGCSASDGSGCASGCSSGCSGCSGCGGD